MEQESEKPEKPVEAQKTEEKRLQSAAAAAGNRCYEDMMATSVEKIASMQLLHERLEEPFHSLADQLFAQFPIMAAKGRLPLRAYRKAAMLSGGNEDECISMLYRLADKLERSSESSEPEEEAEAEAKESNGEKEVEGNGKREVTRQDDEFELID